MNYLALATNLAQTQAARLTAAETGRVTHWNVYDTPVYGHRTQAACGSIVEERAISGTPSCAACRQQLAQYEALQF